MMNKELTHKASNSSVCTRRGDVKSVNGRVERFSPVSTLLVMSYNFNPISISFVLKVSKKIHILLVDLVKYHNLKILVYIYTHRPL